MRNFLHKFTLLLLLSTTYTIFAAKEKKTILIIGETGSGKSLLINNLYNLSQNTAFHEPKDYIIESKYGGHNFKVTVDKYKNINTLLAGGGWQSQTNICTAYEFNDTKYDFILIDTPGIGDTRGLEQDKQNIKMIIEKVQELEINAIGLVVSSGQTRLTASMSYYISELKGMLTQDCSNNFIIIVTHSAGRPTHVVEALEKIGIKSNKVVSFENSALFEFDPRVDLTAAECDLEIDPVELTAIENQHKAALTYSNNKRNWEDLKKHIVSLPGLSGANLKKLSESRDALNREIRVQVEKVTFLAERLQQLEVAQLDAATAQSKMEQNKDFQIPIVRTEEKREQLPAGKKNTVCVSCFATCHEDCGLGGIFTTVGDQKLMECSCMQGSNKGETKGPADKGNEVKGKDIMCNKCGHILGVHVHRDYISKKVTTTTYETVSAKKSIFDSAKNAREKAQAAFAALNNEVKKVQEEIPKAYKEIARLYLEIKKKSMLPINDSLLEYLEQKKKKLEDDVVSSEQKTRELAAIEKAKKEYLVFKETIAKALAQHEEKI